MAKKKSITKDQLVSMYMDYVLTKGHDPKSVYGFATDNNFDEALFYKHYGSFDGLKKDIFSMFYVQTMDLLHSSDDFSTYDSRNKLLSFYFTFFELLTANRSYVVYALDNCDMKKAKQLSGLKKHFKSFINGLDVLSIDLKQERLEKIKERSIEESAYIQLLMTMKFWLDDESANFEKTDLFIEKAVNTSFDLLDTKPLMSLIDLGKFLFKEKVNLN